MGVAEALPAILVAPELGIIHDAAYHHETLKEMKAPSHKWFQVGLDLFCSPFVYSAL
jgi:hypothetical protein